MGADITVIVNAHNEGPLVLHTLKSVAENIAVFEKAFSKTVQVVIVADSPDTATLDSIERFLNSGGLTRITLEIAKYGDLGLSRNHGVEKAEGTFIAFIDADDIWGTNWLLEAYSGAATESASSVWHPELNYYFGYSLSADTATVTRHIASADEEFDPVTLFTDNYWTSACFAKRDLFQALPYRGVSKADRIGYEDWGFNREALVLGFAHKVAPKTVHFIRNKPGGSMRHDHTAFMAVPYPVDLGRLITKPTRP